MSAGRPESLVAAGDLITVAEGDYSIGRGTLRLRVREVLERVGEDLRELTWIQLAGVQLGADGTEHRQRSVIVKASALVANPPQRRRTMTEASDPG